MAVISASRLATIIGSGIDVERAQELIDMASARVEQYAANAPESVKSEAIIRLCGYAFESTTYGGFGSIRELKTGDSTHAPVTNHAASFARSGAGGLLSAWRIRRAGAIKEKD